MRTRTVRHLSRAAGRVLLADATMRDPDADEISGALTLQLIDDAISELVAARQLLPAPIEVAA